MTWEQSLWQHLKHDTSLDMVGGRFHWDVAPPKASLPYVIVQQVSSNESTSWDGGTGGSFPLVQFTVWAKTRLRANVIRRLLRTSLEGKELGVASVSIAGIQDHTDDALFPPIYGAILETRFHISNETEEE